MRIGMDVSIQTCRDEGYLVMDYPVHAFRRDPIKTECRFTKSLPLWIREDVGWTPGQPMIVLDVHYNWEDLYEIYKDNKEGIDSFTGYDYSDIKVPTPRDLLDLASDIDSYCGIEY